MVMAGCCGVPIRYPAFRNNAEAEDRVLSEKKLAFDRGEGRWIKK